MRREAKFDNVVAKFLGKKKIVGEKRENGATNEREKVNSTLSTSQLLPIFSLPVTKNGGERKSKSGNGVVEIRGKREKKKFVIVAIVLQK